MTSLRQWAVSAFLGACASMAIACGSTGVGDPCLPIERPPAPPPGSSLPTCEGAGCFDGREVYIEARSLQCRTRVCMVYQWDEATERLKRPERVFCTCRCDGEGDRASFCTCPENFTCTRVFVAGNPGLRGSYCLRNEIPGISDAGTSMMMMSGSR